METSNRIIVKSTCGLCQAGCGVLVHVENGDIVRIEGNPDSPVNRGVLCAKGTASLDYLNHPDRLKYPLRRKGGKGSGKWDQISWDEALDEIAEEFQKIKAKFGPEAVIFMRGSFKGGYQSAYLARFANVFGSPNIASMASVCYMPRVFGSMISHGFNPVPDYDHPPACIVVWGANMAATRIGEHRQIVKAVQNGAKLLIIDPRHIDLSDSADLQLKPRPGSDLAVALSMLNVIINEELFDNGFVDNWTVGFDELKTHVQAYPPDVAEKLSWVKAGDIQQAARLYARHKPAVIQTGNAIDHNIGNFQTARAISFLRAITGNIGIPGGELFCSSPGLLSPLGASELDLRDMISNREREKRLNAKDGLLPMVYYTLPQSIIKAILEKEPYPIRAGLIQGGNMLLTYSNARKVFQALKRLDFLAVADMFMTPTAALADIVLPVANYLEFDSIAAPPYYPIAQVQQQVTQTGECRSDYEILQGLAQRLDLAAHFWNSERESLDFILKPTGLTFEEFKKVGVIRGRKEYRKHEKDGFATPSGKVELFSERLAEWGHDPLPIFHDFANAPHGSQNLTQEFPFILTSWKSGLYRHSGGRQIATLRKKHSEPYVWLHMDAAVKHGVANDDWVYIETPVGRICQKARLTDQLDPRIVGVDYGWWFPEDGPETLYGWERANINILTDDTPPYGAELGTPNLRGFRCKIYKK